MTARYLEIAAGIKRGPNWDAYRDVSDPDNGVQEYDMRQLPMQGIADDTYDGVYSEHFIEHLHKSEGIAFLKEMHRVLKPGGTIRTVWPAREFIDHLLSDQPLTKDQEDFCKVYYPHYVVRHGFCPQEYRDQSMRVQCAQGLLSQKGEHLYVWSQAEFVQTLMEIGFTLVQSHEYQESRLTDFTGIEEPGKIRQVHSRVVEAQK